MHYSKVKFLIIQYLKRCKNTFVNVFTIVYDFDSESVCVRVFL